MAITSKPFAATDMLAQTDFLGRPNIFCAEDLNRILQAYQNGLINVNTLLGATRVGFDVSLTSFSASLGGGNWTISGEVTLTPWVSNTTMYVYFNGIQYTLPTTLTYSYSEVIAAADLPVAGGTSLYLCLVAHPQTVTFSDDNAYSGVNSSEFPTALPAATNIKWEGCRVVLCNNPPTEITLAGASGHTGAESIICFIGTISAKLRYTAPGTTTATNVWRYNAINPDDFKTTIGQIYDKAQAEIVYPTDNNGMSDLFSVLIDYVEFLQSKYDVKVPGAWQTPSLNSGFTAGFTTLQYRIASDGSVEFKGNVFWQPNATSNPSNGVIFTLPSAYRIAANDKRFPLYLENAGDSSALFGETYVNSSGNVSVLVTGWDTYVSNASKLYLLYLDVIRYPLT